jgi:hypothetical protein
MRKNEMDGACGSYGGEQITEVKSFLEDLNVDWRIVLKWSLKKSVGSA